MFLESSAQGRQEVGAGVAGTVRAVEKARSDERMGLIPVVCKAASVV